MKRIIVSLHSDKVGCMVAGAHVDVPANASDGEVKAALTKAVVDLFFESELVELLYRHWSCHDPKNGGPN